jgi:dolichol-phosphate mannosyltransferase
VDAGQRGELEALEEIAVAGVALEQERVAGLALAQAPAEEAVPDQRDDQAGGDDGQGEAQFPQAEIHGVRVPERARKVYAAGPPGAGVLLAMAAGPVSLLATPDGSCFEKVMSTPPSLSIIFSFRNEEKTLPELLRRCRAVGGELVSTNRISSYEFVFVDDDSSDGSTSLLKREADSAGDVRLVRMSRRFGVSVCVLAGMRHCSGDLVVYMDSDLQDPPELIPELIAVVEKNPDVEVVHTKRTGRDGETAGKLFVTRIGYLLLHFLTNFQLPVECGDFKLLTRRAVNEVLKFKEKKPFMRWIVCMVGFRQEFVPYRRDVRAGGQSHFHILSWRVIANFLESALVSTSVFPLYLISIAGLVSSMICALTLVYILVEKYLGHNLPGWTALMTAGLFIGSVQILSTGLLGLYIASIFEEVKSRPSYIISETYGYPGSESPPQK